MSAIQEAVNQRVWWKWVAAAPIVLIALLLGNLAGLVFASVAGFHGMDPSKPGGVVLGALQAGFGTYMAYTGCQWLLKDHRYAAFWILLLVIVAAAAVILGFLVGVFYLGHWEAVDWKLANGIAGLVTMEFVRRLVNADGIG